MNGKRNPPTNYYAVVFSIVAYKTTEGWVAVLTDMPVRELGDTKEQAVRAAQEAGLRKMLVGEGPPFSGPETEVAASVVQATVGALWRFVSDLFASIDGRANADLIDACEAALPHHQGGHSAVGAKLRRALDKARAPKPSGET